MGSEKRLGGKERGDVLYEKRIKKLKIFYTKKKENTSIFIYKKGRQKQNTVCVFLSRGCSLLDDKIASNH